MYSTSIIILTNKLIYIRGAHVTKMRLLDLVPPSLCVALSLSFHLLLLRVPQRLTTLALKKKRQALQQLNNSNRQLSRVDARNKILNKRRGLTVRGSVAACTYILATGRKQYFCHVLVRLGRHSHI